MKSLFAKTDNSVFFSFSKNMFFIILSCFYCASLPPPPPLFFNLVKITQLQFDWDELECTMKNMITDNHWLLITIIRFYKWTLHM